MKDYRHQTISIGDIVVFIEPNYRNFMTSKVAKIGKVKVTLETGDIRYPRDVIIVKSATGECYGASNNVPVEAFAYANCIVDEKLATAMKECQ